MQIFCQIVGTLVLMSLTATLFLYVGFKRHQKNYKDYLTYFLGYGSVIVSMVFLFSTYFKSVEMRFRIDTTPTYVQQDVVNEVEITDYNIIDIQPLYFCDRTTDFYWTPGCILWSIEKSSTFKNKLNDFVSNSIESSEEL